eukprot:6518903-Pyramimonas_sp.AAC.1
MKGEGRKRGGGEDEEEHGEEGNWDSRDDRRIEPFFNRRALLLCIGHAAGTNATGPTCNGGHVMDSA